MAPHAPCPVTVMPSAPFNRRFPAIAAAVVAGLGAVMASAPASAAALSVPLSETRPLSLPGSAADVLIGDAAIADVTVVDHHHLLIHGKAFGRTNLVVMDGAGRTVFSGPIIVGAGDEDHVSVFRGAQQSDYSCGPRCEKISGAGSIAGAAPVSAPSGPAAAVSGPLTQALSSQQ
ncbi:MAG TPA: pilus assembly protein N-terminal domain-containing protein [Caulobacteraceae bacterium]|nr:pilus assembly protein N-terminal domain-containing protein [Caulobacteraceae bacterium]